MKDSASELQVADEFAQYIVMAAMCGASPVDAAEWAVKAFIDSLSPRRSPPPKPYVPRYPIEMQTSPRLPEKEWLPLRWEILSRDNFTCSYCGRTEEETPMCVDHIVPLSRGGTNERSNLTACCTGCNSSKNDRLLSEWRGRAQ